MNDRLSGPVLVVLNVTPGLEETVVDWLLSREGEKGFTSSVVYGHSSRHQGLSLQEQVSGRRKRVQFEIYMDAAAAATFLHGAVEAFGAADIQCMVVPLLAAGALTRVTELLGAPTVQ